jgi:hypothetical protein
VRWALAASRVEARSRGRKERRLIKGQAFLSSARTGCGA